MKKRIAVLFLAVLLAASSGTAAMAAPAEPAWWPATRRAPSAEATR